MAGGLKDKATSSCITSSNSNAEEEGDLMQAEARQLEKQAAIDAALADVDIIHREAEALADSGLRGDAILEQDPYDNVDQYIED